MKKLIALMLAAVSILGLLAGCGKTDSDEIILPVQTVEDTYENRVKGVLETAFAYYRKNPYVQYDCEALCEGSGRSMGVRNASRMNNTPEMAGPQRTVFHVCSFFTYATTYHTFDYEPQGSWADHGITVMATKTKGVEPYTVYNVALNEMTDEQKLAEMETFRATLQPGDFIYYIRNKTSGNAHAVIWLGDPDGDGEQDMINVDGKYYNDATMEDVREENGAVLIGTKNYSGEELFFNPKRYDYFPTLKYVGVIRYADAKHAETLPMTERAKTRVLFPGLDISYEAENGIFGGVAQGKEYTYTLTLKNTSDVNHEGILVQLPVPANSEIVSVNGTAVKNKTVKMNVNLPAGQEFRLAYTVKATGKVGDVITTGTGYVHAIPLPSLNTTITSKTEDAAKVQSAVDGAKGKTGEAFLADYLTAMGYDLAITGDALQNDFYKTINMGQTKLLKALPEEEVTNLTLKQMHIPDFFGGKAVMTEEDSMRVKEVRSCDLLDGDILIWQEKKGQEHKVAIKSGTDLLQPVDGKLIPMTQADLDHMISYRFFVALRPSMVQ